MNSNPPTAIVSFAPTPENPSGSIDYSPNGFLAQTFQAPTSVGYNDGSLYFNIGSVDDPIEYAAAQGVAVSSSFTTTEKHPFQDDNSYFPTTNIVYTVDNQGKPIIYYTYAVISKNQPITGVSFFDHYNGYGIATGKNGNNLPTLGDLPGTRLLSMSGGDDPDIAHDISTSGNVTITATGSTPYYVTLQGFSSDAGPVTINETSSQGMLSVGATSSVSNPLIIRNMGTTLIAPNLGSGGPQSSPVQQIIASLAGSGNLILMQDASLDQASGFSGIITAQNSNLEVSSTAGLTANAHLFFGSQGSAPATSVSDSSSSAEVSTITLDSSSPLASTIGNWTDGDVLDLKAVPFDPKASTVLTSSNLLQVKTTKGVYSIQISDKDLSGSFSLSKDASGGTKVTFSDTPAEGTFDNTGTGYSFQSSPYSAILSITSGGEIGTGFVIGPHFILTDAHVVSSFDSSGATQIDNDVQVFANAADAAGKNARSSFSVSSDQIGLPTDYSAYRSDLLNEEKDYALIYVPGGDLTSLTGGSYFRIDGSDDSVTANVTGYGAPSNDGGVSYVQYSMFGSLQANALDSNFLQESKTLSYHGSSGGPVWTTDGEKYYAIALVTAGYGGGRDLDLRTSAISRNIVSLESNLESGKSSNGPASSNPGPNQNAANSQSAANNTASNNEQIASAQSASGATSSSSSPSTDGILSANVSFGSNPNVDSSGQADDSVQAQSTSASSSEAGPTNIVTENPDGSTTTQIINNDGSSIYTYSGLSGKASRRFSSYSDTYGADGTYLNEVRDRNDGSHTVLIQAGDQTLVTNQFDHFFNGSAPNNTFVFDPGYGLDTISGFRVDGTDHDNISLLGSDFNNSIASVLHNAQNQRGGVVISDPTSGDSIKLAGITKAQLVHNQADFAFHG